MVIGVSVVGCKVDEFLYTFFMLGVYLVVVWVDSEFFLEIMKI